MFKQKSLKKPWKTFPYGIYTVPEMSMVGKTERQLADEKIPYETGVASYDELAKGQITGALVGMLKIIFDPRTLKLHGVHVIGRDATEVVHIGQTVLAMGGSILYFRDAVFNYPTFAEAYKVAVHDGLNKLSILNSMENKPHLYELTEDELSSGVAYARDIVHEEDKRGE